MLLLRYVKGSYHNNPLIIILVKLCTHFVSLSILKWWIKLITLIKISSFQNGVGTFTPKRFSGSVACIIEILR